ncbi:hypothetical protein BX666DRAFT_1874965 [Dichotomocladium elegans]|nr:hypothetical protein BX666DRAFT_1874965 [Dichotomocladium elegans]
MSRNIDKSRFRFGKAKRVGHCERLIKCMMVGVTSALDLKIAKEVISASTQSDKLLISARISITAGSKTEEIILKLSVTSQRKALYPTDYIYGALGLLDIDIPCLENPNIFIQPGNDFY